MLDKIFKFIERFFPAKYRWILNHDGFKRYFANTGWMFFGQMFSLLISFFIGAWIARYLGPTNYGLVSYVVAFAGLFSFVSSLGIDGILNRELISHPEKRDELMGTGFVLKLFGGGLAFIFSLISAFVFNSDHLMRALLVLFSLSFVLQAPFVINIFFQSQVRARENFKVQFFGTLISSCLKVILILAGGGVIWLILIYALDSLWQGIFLFLFYKRENLKISSWRFKVRIAGRLWHDSWPLMLSSAAAFIYSRIDQVMLGKMMNETAVGLYSAGVKITEVFNFIPGIVCGSLFPAIINAKKTSQKIYNRRLSNLYGLMGLLAFIIALIITLSAEPIINWLFGAQYLESAVVLKIYIWSSMGLFIGTGMTTYLIAENKSKIIFFIHFLAMAVNVVLNLILIPPYGIVGAAWATTISYSILSLYIFLPKSKKNAI